MGVSVQNEVKRIVFTKPLYSVSLHVFCLFSLLNNLLYPSVHLFSSHSLYVARRLKVTSEDNEMSFKSCFLVHTGVPRGGHFLLSGH